MKNLLFTIGIFLLSFGNAFAQDNSFDKKLQNVNQSKLTSGIIYDRVLPLADLGIYNMPVEKPHNTADFRFFNQALFELHKAGNYKKLISIKELDEKIIPYNKEMNIVPIGIINTPFQSLNYNPENPKEGGLILKDSLFVQIPEKEPFLNGYALVVAPLKNVMQGEQIIFKFSEDLIFNNGDTKIKTLIADFGDGKKYSIFEDGKLINSEIKVENFKNNGDKTLHFIVILSNDFTFNTNGKIYTVYGNAINNSSNTQPIACSNSIADPNGLIENFKINYTEATEVFQGLNETVALKGQIEPRVFYHTNNGNTQKTLLKPILIIDGFDPSDGRKIDDCDCERDPVCQEAKKDKATGIYNPENHTSFVESMKYIDDSTTPVFEKNFITVLRAKGYDVILVNQPSYSTNGVTVDGGADFIERNAMAFVQLVKEVNTKLQTNGSTEKLVVMGPSMGGQISRYALAFMEKKFAETGLATWQHNTRIWVAFDSPNHGANVPLGDQALIKMLAGDSVEAQKSFNKLQTTASNEMLINYCKPISTNLPPQITLPPYISSNLPFNLPPQFYPSTIDLPNLDNSYLNASTTSQGMSSNEGNPYFKEHYNNQFNSGLPNSNGFPMNLRKLAIVNGSLTGETFGNGYEKMLDITLSKTIRIMDWNILGWHPSIIYHVKLFQGEAYSMPTSQNIVSHKYKLMGDDKNFYASANSIRGNLDNVPGGSIDATGLLYSAITGEPAPGPRSFWQYTAASAGSFFYNHIGFTPEWETTVLKPNQCFIPTYSGIGINNPNQSWSNPLNRNLVCDPNNKEIYFDSYFGESNNTQHVKLNYRSVNWLLKEIGDNLNPPSPQAPWFPLSDNTLIGASVICNNKIASYSLGSDICKLPSTATWTVSPNLNINSSNGLNITVQANIITDGEEGIITATFQNGMKVEKHIWIGKPVFTFEYSHFDPQPVKSTLSIVSADPNVDITKQGITSVVFRGRKNSNGLYYNMMKFGLYTTRPSGYSNITATVTNSCGSTVMLYDDFNKISNNNNVTIADIYKAFPNPAKDIVSIETIDTDYQPEVNTTITGELFDMMGQAKTKVQIINNKATFSVIGLNKGIYVLKIYINDQVETHQIAVE